MGYKDISQEGWGRGVKASSSFVIKSEGRERMGRPHKDYYETIRVGGQF